MYTIHVYGYGYGRTRIRPVVPLPGPYIAKTLHQSCIQCSHHHVAVCGIRRWRNRNKSQSRISVETLMGTVHDKVSRRRKSSTLATTTTKLLGNPFARDLRSPARTRSSTRKMFQRKRALLQHHSRYSRVPHHATRNTGVHI